MVNVFKDIEAFSLSMPDFSIHADQSITPLPRTPHSTRRVCTHKTFIENKHKSLNSLQHKQTSCGV